MLSVSRKNFWSGLDFTVQGGAGIITSCSANSGEVYVDDFVTVGGVDYPVTTIGAYALHGSHQVTDVRLPDSIELIDDGAFAHCGSLKNVDIPATLIPLVIKDMAFAYCYSLTNITFNGNVASIGDLAFLRCSNLKEIWFLGDLPTSIGTAAFHGTHDDLRIYYSSSAGNAGVFEGLFNNPDIFWSDPDVSEDTRATNPSAVLVDMDTLP